MTAARANTHICYVDAHQYGTDTWGANTTNWATNRKSQPVWDVGTVPKYASITRQGQRRDFGRHKAVKGLPEAPIQMTCYAEGLGSVAADGDPATPTFLTHCWSAAFGVAPTLPFATLVATGTDTTQIVQEAEGTAFSAGCIIAYELADGSVECRPIYSSVTVTHTLAILASEDPADGNDIYATANVLWVNPTGPSAYTLVAEFRGMRDADTWRVYNVLPNITWNGVGRNEVQTITIGGNGAGGFVDNLSSSLSPPTAIRPVVAANGKCILAPSGSGQTGTELTVFKWELNLGITASNIPSTNPAHAASGVVPNADPMLKLTLLDDSNPPGGTNSTYGELFRDGTDNSLQFFAYNGDSAGSIAGVWLKLMHLEEDPQHAEMDGINTIELMFRVTSGVTDPAIVFFQA